jgi:hypothetical protein
MKNIIIVVTVIAVIGGAYYYVTKSNSESISKEETTSTPLTNTDQPGKPLQEKPSTMDDSQRKATTTIGLSLQGKEIVAYHFGTGSTELLFIGGIHGGYEWNTVLLSYELIDFLNKNPKEIPENIRITIIPVLNPDGLQKVTGTTGRFTKKDIPSIESLVVSGRFNARDVDLNRNFDCKWKKEGVWQTRKVSGGSAPFSEPESKAIKDYVEKSKPTASIVWYSAGGGVYASACDGVPSTETKELTSIVAKASGYPAHQSFDYYETSGDIVNWLAKNNIPAISILLSNHSDTEWAKNKAGIQALINYYAQ